MMTFEHQHPMLAEDMPDLVFHLVASPHDERPRKSLVPHRQLMECHDMAQILVDLEDRADSSSYT
jgi:hypothetical protein